jgi:hypothetical protein
LDALNAVKTHRKWLFFLFFVLFFAIADWGPNYITHPLPQPLPTQMVFKKSVFRVQQTIHQIFTTEPQALFQSPVDAPLTFTLYWKSDRHPPGIRIFRNLVNENDVYVSCNKNPICKSTVYTDGWGKPLEYFADFQMHIIPQGAKETLVRVITVNAQVKVGKDYWNVLPTTVEENEILLNIKKNLNRSKSNKSNSN